MSARAAPRTTRDVDVAIAVQDDPDAEALIQTLHGTGRYQIATVLEQTSAGRMAAARLRGPAGVVVDLLFASSGIESEIAEAAETLELVPGLTLPVARTGHLVALKLLARDDRSRPQDYDDLQALLRGISQVELTRAREAVALILERGFSRGRDLASALDQVLGA